MNGETSGHPTPRHFTVACIVALVATVVLSGMARAQTGPPVRIAIPAFASDGAEVGEWAQRIVGVITDNLARSNVFIPLEPTAMAQERVSLNSRPRFEDWRAANAQVLMVGQVTEASGGRLSMAFRLWDVASGEQMAGEQYFAVQQQWRRLAHVAADVAYARVTGAQGYFDTRIAFIERRPEAEGGGTRIAVMDQDGTNLSYVSNGAENVISLRFSLVAQQLVHVSEIGGVPRVYLRDLQHGIREVVGDFPGLVSAPRFSPDGTRIVMSIKRGGNANLYTLDLRTRQMQRLTETAALDTDPAYAPAGRRIVFVSQRTGTQQLYVMNAGGGAAQRISRGEGDYSQPAWSPRGDLIAFVKRVRGHVALGLMSPDGTNERLLAGGTDISGLSWAPNGRALVFARRGAEADSGPRLFTISVSGTGERMLATPYPATGPSWSATLGQRNPSRFR